MHENSTDLEVLEHAESYFLNLTECILNLDGLLVLKLHLPGTFRPLGLKNRVLTPPQLVRAVPREEVSRHLLVASTCDTAHGPPSAGPVEEDVCCGRRACQPSHPSCTRAAQPPEEAA